MFMPTTIMTDNFALMANYSSAKAAIIRVATAACLSVYSLSTFHINILHSFSVPYFHQVQRDILVDI